MPPEALSRFVQQSFTCDEFFALVAMLPDGPNLTAQLPLRPASLELAVHGAFEVLGRNGVIDKDLILVLVRARPARAGEVRAAAVEAGIVVAEAEYVEALVAAGSPHHAITLLAEENDPTDAKVLMTCLLRALPKAGMFVAWRSATEKLEAIQELATGPLDLARHDRRAAEIYADVRRILRESGDVGRAADRLSDLAHLCGVSLAAEQRCLALRRKFDAWRWSGAPFVELREIIRAILAMAREMLDGVGAEKGAVRAPARGGALPVLRCAGLQKRYPGGFELAIDSLVIQPGEIVGIVGPNGAGKSSLLRIVCGELSLSGGELAFPALGIDRPVETSDWMTLRQDLRYVPQQRRRWYGPLEDNLRMWASMFRIQGQKNEGEVNRLISRLGLEPHRGKLWEQLSAGFRTRLDIARALLGSPRLLVLDEPLALLDINAQFRVLRSLRELIEAVSAEPAVILSSQHIHEIEPFVSRLLFLDGSGRGTIYRDADEIRAKRATRVFELGRPLSFETRDRIRVRFPGCSFDDRDGVAFLDVPPEYPVHELLTLLDWGTGADYVREISGSAMRLMREV